MIVIMTSCSVILLLLSKRLLFFTLGYVIYGIGSQGSTQKAAIPCSKVLSYSQKNPNNEVGQI